MCVNDSEGEASDPSTPRGKIRLSITESLERPERSESTDPHEVLVFRTNSTASVDSVDTLDSSHKHLGTPRGAAEDEVESQGVLSVGTGSDQVGPHRDRHVVAVSPTLGLGASGKLDLDELSISRIHTGTRTHESTNYDSNSNSNTNTNSSRDSSKACGDDTPEGDFGGENERATPTKVLSLMAIPTSPSGSLPRSESESSLLRINRAQSIDSTSSQDDTSYPTSPVAADGQESPRISTTRDYRVVFSTTPLGLTLTKDHLGGAVVTKMVAGGQAERLGVECGHQVIGVDDEWIASYDGLMDSLRCLAPARMPVTLVLRSHGALTLERRMEVTRAVSVGALNSLSRSASGAQTAPAGQRTVLFFDGD